MIIFGAPLIMAFTAGMILNILASVDTTSFTGFQSVQNTQLGLGENFANLVTITPQFIGMINTLIVTSSLLAAFVITKAIDFTFYNTWRVVAIGGIAAVSILFIDQFTGINFDAFSEAMPF